MEAKLILIIWLSILSLSQAVLVAFKIIATRNGRRRSKDPSNPDLCQKHSDELKKHGEDLAKMGEAVEGLKEDVKRIEDKINRAKK